MRRRWLFPTLGLVFLLLVVGSVLAGIHDGTSAQPAAKITGRASVAQPTPPATSTPQPTARPRPTALPLATHVRTCSVGTAASDPDLLSFEASVINVTTGEVLLDRQGATPARTASVLKTLTAAAALQVLGPQFQIATTVSQGAAPGTVVLVGAGDPTLSATADTDTSIYAGAPKLTDLAAQVKASWTALHPGQPITDLVLDSSYWDPNDNWDPSVERSEQTGGYQPEITALMVDGSRANPHLQDSPRSNDPIGDAGTAFAADLGITGATHITRGTAVAGSAVLGTVKSQPLSILLGQMLPNSDNTLAEMLARITSKGVGNNGSSASLATVIPAALAKYGLDTTGVTIRDGSGESSLNLVPATFVAKLMAKVAAGEQNLSMIYKVLPISGQTGTLAARFTGANSVARGSVIAKTGWITTEYSLAGVIHASDGTVLSFAFYALGAITPRTIPALDTIATAVFSCGDNLANS